MKKKLSILAFTLLLAVGWTNVVSAQRIADISELKVQLAPQQLNSSTAEQNAVIANGDYQRGGALYAPQRAANNYTTPVVHERSWYEQRNYTWMDGNTQKWANLTDVVTDPVQMWYLLRYVYNTDSIPGPHYNKVYETTQTYPRFAYGWENENGTMPTNITITLSNSYARVFNIDIYDATGNTSLLSLTATNLYNSYGCSRTTYSYNGTNYYVAYINGGGTINIPVSSLGSGVSDGIQVKITAVASSSSNTSKISVNGTTQTLEYGTPYIYQYEVMPSVSAAPMPLEDGHTVFLVKVTDETTAAPRSTVTKSDLTNIFGTYIESIELLTDGLRVDEEGGDQAGTVFTYSGSLNKFFFIGKSKLAKFGYLAPFYGMYEEYSPTTTAEGDEITDFYSKMLEGDSYNIIHDCASVLYMKHPFSMTGNSGTEEKSLTNLIFYIPDERGRSPYDSIGNTYHSRNYELRPQVGLYTIKLTAEAEPVANYSESNRNYDVTCSWVSSLNTITDVDVPQTYQLWIFVYDEQGNPVPVPESDGGLLYEGPNTSYTYQVPQFPESYTIIYRVIGWPTNATNSYANGGDFYAWSNLDDVLIPGYEDFLSLSLDHYESDFKINEEHNYYRNFFTVDNQNPENVLTAQRVLDGENLFKLYRYDVADENNKVKAAELRFYQRGNDIRYKIDYFDQQILSGYELPMTSPVVIDTAGVVATIGSDKYVKVTSSADLTSGQYLIVYENGSYAMNGGMTNYDAANNFIPVTITNNTIPANATTNAASFTITFSGSTATILGAGGMYVGRTSNSNGINSSSTELNNTITLSGSDALIAGSGNGSSRYLQFNTGWPGFRYYTSGNQQAIQLYKKTGSGGGTTPTVNPVGNITITMDNGNFSFRTIQVKSGNTVLTEWSYATNQTGLPNGWSTTTNFTAESTSSCYMSGGGTITINSSLLQNAEQVTVVMNGRHDPDYSSDVIITVAGSTGTSSTQTLTQANDATWADYTWTVNGTSGAKAEPTRAYTLLDSQIDNANYSSSIEGNISPSAPWQATSVYYQTNKYFYIISGGNLKFTVPAGYNGANLKFVVHNSNNTYYNGTFVFASSNGTTQTITCNTADQDYETIFTNVAPGDVITITGTHGSSSYSPDFSRMYVYVEGGSSEYSLDDPLYLSEIQIVDQFKAETKNDIHPYRYGYYLQYDPATGDPKKSSVQEVPVQHTGANMHGYYTTSEIQGDTDRGLTMDVMNAEVEMKLTANPEVYYYTLDRKPSTNANANWLEISMLQKRENDTYQEMDNLLTQYVDETYDPVATPRYDNYDVQIGNWNDYMNYAPIVWTHGELTRNRRIKWETERLHNSYGAPIWKTGVGKVEIHQGTYAERQTGKFGSTNWTDENGDSCSLYMLVLDAKGFLPTANTIGNQNGYVPYVPYWFNVYAKSETGKLRGFSWVGEGSPGAGHPGEPGSHVVNDQTHNRYLWHLYGGPTTDGILQHGKSDTWAENWIFGALDDIDDLEIVVRYYYVVNGMAGRDGGPAGYGSESPGFAPPTPTAVLENWTNRTIVSTIYVNPQGMQSDKPFDGVNIVINRYEDGSTSTSKVIK